MYRAPVSDIFHTLMQVAGLEKALAEKRFPDFSADLALAILEEAGKFAAERIEPLRSVGDREGATLENGVVTTTPGWKELYRDWIEGGWNALTGSPEYGGQGLPVMLSVAVSEMWNSGSLAFAIAPTLTMGAVEALEKHATKELKDIYLEKLISGEWMGTMNLTEPQAGSDLGALRTRAERHDDGTYRIFGQKIFITYGEHDLSENIVHLVLARLPDAPAGTRGISLFLVPKFLVNKDGSPGRRNDVFCSGLEHKMGIHASPTCTMIYGDGFVKGAEAGAVGYLIGEENRGLACMFTMMNNARLLVGIQGVGVAEAAFQQALAYAKERKQGRAAGAKETMSPIIEHPDVQRMLLTMKALTQVARSITYACAHAIDMSRASEGAEAQFWADRAGLLTPLAKSFATDAGVEVASLGVQVHGGMGFIEETGAAQLLRDARITPIYEGTNGIQAIDLVMRKLPLADGAHVAGFLDELQQEADEASASKRAELGETGSRLALAITQAREATSFLQKCVAEGRTEEALAGATPYLRLLSLVAGGGYLARTAFGNNDGGRATLCRFYAENMLAETSSLKDTVISGASSLAAAKSLLET
ncbi:acyl-CoA dehydrogenase [Falsochrobactrum shanghaiense]|uniref:3-methylmercaptopropionyl-CoA dehydrogenase n=1 Tax=Falsochrobactrum shanghaiense TaxID=2201899 RepID=A0A316JCM6_9HYPH|nr:acyl-CoA dehydrogenase [Falsochrobactrum shanghaiense]PWL19146.1 acyl-CoA dehydrogenase [Falsochrobactrum shanghaiense]